MLQLSLAMKRRIKFSQMLCGFHLRSRAEIPLLYHNNLFDRLELRHLTKLRTLKPEMGRVDWPAMSR